MSKVHLVKQRITSVGKISQITAAMEKVAASKMRRAQEATLRSRTYAFSAREVLARLYQLTSPRSHALFEQRPFKQQLIILFSSDRGLAGSYNTNLFKAALADIAALPTNVIVIGRKGAVFLSKLKNAAHVIGAYTDWPHTPTSADVRPIVETAIKLFIEGGVDAVRLIYTEFISAAKQQVVRQTVLPIDPAALLAHNTNIDSAVQEAEFEPSPDVVLAYIVPRLLEVQVYQASLEALASEHSMRMMAMKNASDNAEELKGDLLLTYNSARQAAITQELAEITAGAEAIN